MPSTFDPAKIAEPRTAMELTEMVDSTAERVIQVCPPSVEKTMPPTIPATIVDPSWAIDSTCPPVGPPGACDQTPPESLD
jgi:hypothetical protein